MTTEHLARTWLSGIAAVGALALAGCQTYTPRPLDAAKHRSEFLARSPESERVAQFAQRLSRASSSPVEFNPADGVTLQEAEIIALVFNTDLRRARARAGVAAAVAAHAGLWEDPVLGTDLTRIIQDTPHPWKVFTTVGLTIPISGRLKIEKLRAGAEHAAELARIHEAEWAVRTDLRGRWAEWAAARHRYEILRDLVRQLDALLGIVERIEQAGELARLETGLFRIESASRAAALEQARAAVQESELSLRRLMGLAPSAPVSFVHAEPPLPTPGPDDPAAAAEESNPGLAVARAEYQTAERRLELEIRKQYPDLQIGPGYGREGGQDQFLLNLSIPLPIFNRNQQGIAAAAAERDAARVAFEAAAEELASDLQTAATRLGAAAAQARIFERGMVPLVDQQYADARRTAELGEVNAFLLLETLTRQQDAKLALIDARLAERLAAIRVQALVGPSEPAPDAVPEDAQQ